jgi:hypothetical protein
MYDHISGTLKRICKPVVSIYSAMIDLNTPFSGGEARYERVLQKIK